MTRWTEMMLRAALLLSSMLSVVYIVRVFVAQFAPVEWYWGGAVAIFAAPLLFASGLHLLATRADLLKERV